MPFVHASLERREGMENTQGRANKSAVAALRQKIDEEDKSAKLGLSGLASGTARHEVITAKMERVSALHEELRTHVGDQAMPLFVQCLDGAEIDQANSVVARLLQQLREEYTSEDVGSKELPGDEALVLVVPQLEAPTNNVSL
jgi:hypothetical protein